jgi:ABC-type multidrug transport system ATPase subunit
VPRGIELRDLAKSYGAIEAVRGIDLDIEVGETVALLGPNGAGKSTMIAPTPTRRSACFSTGIRVCATSRSVAQVSKRRSSS